MISDPVFHARLRSVMKDNAYDRYVRGRKRGKLDMKSLYKVPAKRENVFALKEARKNKHYNVVLLVDQSGSMFAPADNNSERGYEGQPGSRVIDLAADCATFLAKSLDKVQVNYSIIGYDSEWRWHKKFAQGASEQELQKINYSIAHTGGGGTQLWQPMVTAYRELRKTPDYRNIIICISDGQPGESVETIRQYVRGNRHIADFIDIGINNRPVLLEGLQIRTIQHLKPLLIKELSKRIKRG